MATKVSSPVDNASGVNSPPPPPRLTGTLAIDVIALREWFWTFYQSTVVQSGLLDPVFQSNPGTFDPANLPNPADTSIARAQDTANHAYMLAALVQTDLPQLLGPVTINDGNNQLTFGFTAPQANAKYSVIAQPVGFTGVPSSGAFLVVSITKTVSNFVMTLFNAPGAGTSVTYDIILVPTPGA